jgi:hypothetical protein
MRKAGQYIDDHQGVRKVARPKPAAAAKTPAQGAAVPSTVHIPGENPAPGIQLPGSGPAPAREGAPSDDGRPSPTVEKKPEPKPAIPRGGPARESAPANDGRPSPARS